MSDKQNINLVMKIEWSTQAVLKLIEHFKNAECLYNTRHHLYHNKHARQDALENLSIKMSDTVPGITPEEIKTKLNYLRSQYGRELLKASESKKSGIGTDDVYVPSAYWFEHLHFLKDFVRVRKGRSNILEMQTIYDFSLPESQNGEQPSSSKHKQLYDNSFLSEKEDSTPVKKRKELSRTETDDALKTATNYLKKLSENEKRENTFTEGLIHFIEQSIIEITDKNLRDEVSSKIMLLIFEYMKKQRELDTNKT